MQEGRRTFKLTTHFLLAHPIATTVKTVLQLPTTSVECAAPNEAAMPENRSLAENL
jgi:hypothetical protein